MSKITESARGQHCTLRFYDTCDPATTVFCHIQRPGFGIMGGKVSDLFGAYGCHRCHDVIDRRGHEWREFSDKDILERAFAGMIETQTLMLEAKLIAITEERN